MTVAAVAERAGVSRATAYRYFVSNDAVTVWATRPMSAEPGAPARHRRRRSQRRWATVRPGWSATKASGPSSTSANCGRSSPSRWHPTPSSAAYPGAEG